MATDSLTHYGSWDSVTRSFPALHFMEMYSTKVDSIDITGPFHYWYAPSAKFYNGDGVVYNGGKDIWSWMSGLFGPFAAVHHDIEVIRLFKSTQDAYWVTIETQTAFHMKGALASPGPIIVPRFLMFLVGKSEVEGQGTDGLQILEAKAWWDTAVLSQEIAKRKQQLAAVA